MNSTTRTLTFFGVAVASSLAAWFSYEATQPSDVSGYTEVGSEFFPEFDDATKATALAVTAYDEDTGGKTTFEVRKNDEGLWVIPSHHNYPAEAKDRLARTATSLLGVKRTAVASRFEDDWKRYGVVDPEAEGGADKDARGTRLTLSDGSGNPVVDMIVGKSVEGRSSHYYVRQPDKPTTYVSELDIDLSTKFSDWIEPDLLKLNSSDIVKLTLDNYSIDEQRGTIRKKELLEFTKEDLKSSGDWKLTGLDEETEELDKSPVSAIATNLDGLKIVGVREKPEGLSDDLRVPPQIKQILQDRIEAEMQQQGYFIGPDESGEGKKLYGNEGELVAGTESGVQYTLYFGEIARGSAKDIESGITSSDDKKDDKKDGEKDGEESDDSADGSDDKEDGPRRYLLVKVDLNEALLGAKPVAPTEPVKPDILKEAEKPAAETSKGDASPDKEEKKEEKAAPPKETSKDESTESATEEKKPEEAADTSNADKEAAEESKEDGSCEPFDEEEATAKDAAADESAETKKDAADSDPKTKEGDKKEDAAAAPATKPDAKTETPKAADDKKADNAEPKAVKSADVDDKDKAPTADTKKPEEKPAVPEKSPREIAQEEYDKAMVAYNSAKRTYDSDLKAYEEKLEKGKEKVEELSARFAGWYYVISSDSFEKFRITRNDVVSKKEKEEEKKEGDEKSAEEK